MNNIITGVDIGGTHITVCLINIDNGEVIKNSHVRAHVNTSLASEAIISSWAEVIKKAHYNTEVVLQKIGIAMPGPFDYEKGISLIKGLHKYESLYGLNVKELLAEELDINPKNIRLVNDASAYLLGEMRKGAGKGYSNLVGITLGTGLGSAVYYDNTLHDGDLYRFDYENRKCEDFISARWLIFEYEKLTGIRLNNVKELADRCENEKEAKLIFEEYGTNLFRILYKRYRQQSPELVIIGGNIAKAWDRFIPAAMNAMADTGFHFTAKQAELGEEAALTGAAYLWSN